jgi:hypothetical protein
MSNTINEEINKMMYLFGYKPGRVISEQVMPDELDEARGKKVDIQYETQRIFDEIKDRVMKNNEIMWSDFQTLYKKDKDKSLINSLAPYYNSKLTIYNDLSQEEKNDKFREIMSRAGEVGDLPFQDVIFINKNYPNAIDELKSLLSFENPFVNVTKNDRISDIINKAKKTGEINHTDYQFLRNNKPTVLDQLKPFISKQIGRKKYMTDDILLDKLIEIESRIKSEKDIRRRDYVYLTKNAPDILQELKPYWGKSVKLRNLPEDELNKRYEDIIETCKRIKDIYASDYAFLKQRNPELLEELRVYWGKYTPKPKPVIPEPVIEPEITNTGIGVRGRKPLTPEQIKKRIEDIKNRFSETGKLENKDYQFLFKYGGDVLKTMVRPKKTKSKMEVDLNPEEIEYEPIGKLGDYWSSSSTGNYDYKYEN